MIDIDLPHEPHPGLSPTLSQSGQVLVSVAVPTGEKSPYGCMEANPTIPPPLRGETGPLAALAYVHPFLNMVTGKITSE